MLESIQAYYNHISTSYDETRFGASSYGQYLHRQEHALLNRWMPENPTEPVLDIGCGTGRFLARATDGVDFSAGMLQVARQKWPDKKLHFANITATNLPDGAFTRAFSLHVLMHLDQPTTSAFLTEAHRLLARNGQLLVDFPSQHRRALGRRKVEPDHWHGSTEHTTTSLLNAGRGLWKLIAVEGLLFLPIHRIPTRLRPTLWQLDHRLCQSRLQNYASYLAVVLEKL